DQGAPRSDELDLAREIAAAVGFPHYAVGHNVSLRKGRYGNATLSRFPILRKRNIDLTIFGHKRRGCQHATLEIERPGGKKVPFEVFNLHLGLSAREREQQVGLLMRSREFTELEMGSACLVGGDFNDWRSRLRAIFTEIFEFDCATDRNTARGPNAIKTYPSFSPRGGLDKLYYRGPLRLGSAHTCRLQIARVASDHLPVVAELELD
ncbi:MAG TPA: endonuclease/exonuclease/phosphatase family protein, partial [Thermoanaerobaculia bacterium]|nr:endonuclease/exonuclease/phosphatase family protein [Thermoanaerobaculia bacterium]